MEKDTVINEINSVLDQIKNGVEIQSCRCSYYPVRQLLEAALNGEIGEEFRLLNSATGKVKEELVKSLANLILKK